MKKNSVILLVISLFLSAGMLQAQVNEGAGNKTGVIEVYYFHYTHRCATCMAVEAVTEKSLRELYPEKMKSGDIIFLSVNIEEESNKPLVEQYKIGGQTLIFTKNEKTEKDLTNKAFMYAREQPEKLKSAIKKTIDEL